MKESRDFVPLRSGGRRIASFSLAGGQKRRLGHSLAALAADDGGNTRKAAWPHAREGK